MFFPFKFFVCVLIKLCKLITEGLLSVQIYRISALEKERNTPLYSRRSEFRKDYCELEELDLKGTNDRKSESEYHFSITCKFTIFTGLSAAPD